jgi:hypothetical protein
MYTVINFLVPIVILVLLIIVGKDQRLSKLQKNTLSITCILVFVCYLYSAVFYIIYSIKFGRGMPAIISTFKTYAMVNLRHLIVFFALNFLLLLLIIWGFIKKNYSILFWTGIGVILIGFINSSYAFKHYNQFINHLFPFRPLHYFYSDYTLKQLDYILDSLEIFFFFIYIPVIILLINSILFKIIAKRTNL